MAPGESGTQVYQAYLMKAVGWLWSTVDRDRFLQDSLRRRAAQMEDRAVIHMMMGPLWIHENLPLELAVPVHWALQCLLPASEDGRVVVSISLRPILGQEEAVYRIQPLQFLLTFPEACRVNSVWLVSQHGKPRCKVKVKTIVLWHSK